jgi:hypothetical protein
LLDQEAAKPRAVDEQLAGNLLSVLELHYGNNPLSGSSFTSLIRPPAAPPRVLAHLRKNAA